MYHHTPIFTAFDNVNGQVLRSQSSCCAIGRVVIIKHSAITCHHSPSPHTLHRGAQRAACPLAQAATAFTSECRGGVLAAATDASPCRSVVLVLLCLFHIQSSTTVSQLKSQHLQLPCLICNRLCADTFSKATSCRPKSTRTCSLRLISLMFCFRALFVNNIMIFALGAAVEPRAHGAKALCRYQHLFACTLSFTAGSSSS